MRDKNDLFYQCINGVCKYYAQLIIYNAPTVALGVISLPNLRCECGHEPIKLTIRGE